MRLQTRTIVNKPNGGKHYVKIEIPINKDTIIIEAESPSECVIMYGGSLITIMNPYSEIQKIIDNESIND